MPVQGDASSSVVCPGCKRFNPRDAQFCDSCGAALWQNCPQCSFLIAAGVRFCSKCGTDIPKARVKSIHHYHEKKLKAVVALMAQGAYKQAALLLESLRHAFPADAQIAELEQKCKVVMERANLLLGDDVRELLAQRKLISLEREIAWLEAQRIQVAKLMPISKAVRQKIAAANALYARAKAEFSAGHLKNANRFARSVLVAVADHEGALELVRSTGDVTERVAQLEEIVRRRNWVKADHVLKDIDESFLADPRMAKIRARVQEEIGKIYSFVWILRIIILIVILSGLIVALYYPPFAEARSRQGLLQFIGVPIIIWGCGSIILLGIVLLSMSNKGQVLRCHVHSVKLGRRRKDELVQLLPDEIGVGGSAAGQAAVIDVSSVRIVPLPELTKAQQLDIIKLEELDDASGGASREAVHAKVDSKDDDLSPVILQELTNSEASRIDDLFSTNPMAHQQRVENTAMAIEWQLFIVVIVLLQGTLYPWLGTAIQSENHSRTLLTILMPLGLLAAALMVGGKERIHAYWLPMILSGLAVLCTGIDFDDVKEPKWAWLSYGWFYVATGTFSAALFKLPIWRGLVGLLPGFASTVLFYFWLEYLNDHIMALDVNLSFNMVDTF